MAHELENAVVALVMDLLSAQSGDTPWWLKHPGKLECGDRWPLVKQVYADLEAQELPETAPPREWRHVDAVLTPPAGETFILEFDETQHFNRYRRMTLERYPDPTAMRFDLQAWMNRCDAKRQLEGGGFAKPRPPLFPGENGRHRQRAFRDALADLLPPLHGFGPTLRIADFEVADWIHSMGARNRMTTLLRSRGLAL